MKQKTTQLAFKKFKKNIPRNISFGLRDAISS